MLLGAAAVHEVGAKRQSAALTLDESIPSDVAAVIEAQESADLDQTLQAAVADALPAPSINDWQTIEVQRGQTLSKIFEEQGLGFSEAIAVVKLSKDSARLKNLRAGDKIVLRKTPDDKLDELHYEIDEVSALHIRRTDDDQLEATTTTAELEHRQTQAVVTIENSLFLDGQRAGISNRLLIQLAQMFGYDIDFALDLRVGDKFALIYDAYYKDGEKLRDGNIVAAQFVNRGRSFRAVRYVDADGNASYYTPEGLSLRKAFMRTPVDFSRISSYFNPARRHPILNTIRGHKGVDYAAATGTPIRATANGQVEFIGVQRGYGRVIILKHGAQYTTLYAHMSRFNPNLRNGQKVRQGQVIGYVGQSGMATGPHLHYEFRVNGVHKNPLSVTLPRSLPLPPAVLARWKANQKPLIAQLDHLLSSQVAQADAVGSH
ncbi:peptidoglycan DD-metalloendopeptidase family protein [Sinimarinibacterium sp. NLF-5-8]|nr:M23 family metallopeptidase [Sinimarinibacterium sp. NLF-5-8]QHS11039.1 peptidoglycan DD-metalloendopeptidase family protein [Sinimarinibacterium sp. NLF-5-8]